MAIRRVTLLASVPEPTGGRQSGSAACHTAPQKEGCRPASGLHPASGEEGQLKRFLAAAGFCAVATAAAVLLVGSAADRSAGQNILRDAALGRIGPAHITIQVKKGSSTTTVTKTMPFFSPATLDAAEEALGVNAQDEREEGSDAATGGEFGSPSTGQTQGT